MNYRKQFMTTAPIAVVLCVGMLGLTGCPWPPGAGQDQVYVPAVDGFPQDWAAIELAKAGLQVGAITEVYNNTTAEAFVLSQSPAADVLVDANSQVDLEVSLGPAPGGFVDGALLCTQHLTGDQEVPAVDTDAQGVAVFHWYESEGIVQMILYHDVENVTMAHFHSGAPGENGPAEITLDVSTNPIIHDLTEAAYNELLDSPHYINVHSEAHGPGEIRADLDCAPLIVM